MNFMNDCASTPDPGEEELHKQDQLHSPHDLCELGALTTRTPSPTSQLHGGELGWMKFVDDETISKIYFLVVRSAT